MDRDRYRRLRLNPRLRDALLSATGTQPPTRSQLEADLADAGIPPELIGEVVDDAAELADAVARGARPFHVRQEADERALAWLDRLEADDRLATVDTDDTDDHDAEQSAADALARKRTGVVGNPTLRQTTPANVPWKQQR